MRRTTLRKLVRYLFVFVAWAVIAITLGTALKPYIVNPFLGALAALFVAWVVVLAIAAVLAVAMKAER